MKYYRVKYGFGKDDFYSIPETDLEKAMRAQIKGTIFVCDEGTIAGNNIPSIMPEYQRALGVNRDYSLTVEDYRELGIKAVEEHRTFLSEVKRLAIGAPTGIKQLKDEN